MFRWLGTSGPSLKCQPCHYRVHDYSLASKRRRPWNSRHLLALYALKWGCRFLPRHEFRRYIQKEWNTSPRIRVTRASGSKKPLSTHVSDTMSQTSRDHSPFWFVYDAVYISRSTCEKKYGSPLVGLIWCLLGGAILSFLVTNSPLGAAVFAPTDWHWLSHFV